MAVCPSHSRVRLLWQAQLLFRSQSSASSPEGLSFHRVRFPMKEQSGQTHINSPNPSILRGLFTLRAEHGRLGDIIPFVRVRILPEGFIL